MVETEEQEEKEKRVTHGKACDVSGLQQSNGIAGDLVIFILSWGY